MKISIPEISKQIYKEDILPILDEHYSTIGAIWTNYQLEWINDIYKTFKDHDKFLIVIYLIKKTLDFYSRNFTKLSFEKFYSKDTVEIEKFSISEISINLNIPKESARRKILELERDLIIKRVKKKIIIDRSSYPGIKPINSIIRISRFLSTLSNILKKENILLKNISSESLDEVIKDNFSYVWKLYYEFQIPMILGYKKKFEDLESFHIFGTCVVNEHYFATKENNINKKRKKFYETIHKKKVQGVNAMSISEITGIPRATVIRKLKKMVSLKCLMIDNKKHYYLTESFVKKLMPLQEVTLSRLADFSSKIYNLKIL